MKVLINSTKSHLTKINLILSKILGASFYSERSWSDLFSIFCARVTKLRKFRNTAIVTNCKAFKNQFTLGPIFSRSFTRAPRNCRERKDVRHSVQTAKHPKSFQSKITPSDIFSSIFRARGKIIKKERPLLLQTAKHFQVIQSKNTRSLNLLREAKLLRRKERYYYKLQSIQQSFQSKITRSDIFPQSFARAAKLLRRKDRYFYKLQSIFKSFQSKNTRSLNLLRARQNY